MRYPLVKQNGIKDCGPCSLASIIIYYNGYLSVDMLSNMMHTTKNGTTAYDLIETAKKIGFDAQGIKQDNLNQVKLPCIVHVTLDNIYDHYIIVYKVEKKRILIGDPSDKVKYISLNEFNKIWNKIIIILTPLKPMPKIDIKSLPKYILNILKENIYTIIIITIVTIIFIFVSFLYAFFIKYIIDNIGFVKTNICLLFVILTLIRLFLLYIKNNIIIKFNKKLSISLTNRVINTLIKLPYPFYRNHQTGELISRFNDLESIKSIIIEMVTTILELPLLIIFLIIMYNTSKILFLLTFIILLIYLVVCILLSYKVKIKISEFYEKKDIFNSILVENVAAFETIKGLNIEENVINKISTNNISFQNIIYKYHKLINNKDLLVNFINDIGIIIILVFGLALIDFKLITLGGLVTYYLLYNYIIEPVNNIINIIIKYEEAKNASRRIQEFNYNVELSGKITNNFDILYDHLYYKIGCKTVLKDINLNIKKGSKVFITGSTGSGKSTLVKLLKGYYKASNLYLSNIEIGKCNLDKVLYVNQNEVLFTDTLYNNLMSNDKSLKDIVKMCLVNKNLNMFIEENGFNLSGGEKQRIVLARTLLKDFEILIIDEGLNQIDVNKERVILKNIFNKYNDKTIIVISHRLDNLDLYDQFIEMSEGKIVKDVKKHFN